MVNHAKFALDVYWMNQQTICDLYDKLFMEEPIKNDRLTFNDDKCVEKNSIWGS